MRAASELGVKYLTIYSFSAENWSRPADEINDLMGLLKWFVRKDLAELHESGVKVKIIGERTGLDSEVLALLREAEELTKANERTTLIDKTVEKMTLSVAEQGYAFARVRPRADKDRRNDDPPDEEISHRRLLTSPGR